MTLRRVGLALLVCSGAWGLAHCSDYGEDDVSPTPPADAGADAPEAGRAFGCTLAKPPPMPADDDPATARDYWFAFDSVELPVPVTGTKHPGLDLDDSCTCGDDANDGGAPCETPSTARVTCDFDDGVDDALGATVGTRLAGGGTDLSAASTKLMRNGSGTLLVFLGGYNGKANDADVNVQFVRSTGLFSDESCKGEPGGREVTASNPDGGALPTKQYAPLFDGCDRFSPKPGTTNGKYPNRLPFAPVKGYVVDHQLVMKTAEVEFPFSFAEVLVKGTTTVAKLTPEGSSFRLDGIFTGRVAFDALVSFVAAVPFDGAPLCTTPAWSVIGPTLCDARDAVIATRDQFQGKICDAATFASSFTARPAQVGDLELARVRPPSPCAESTVTCE